ncbi:hypothetical protein SLS62_003441 [Diatrype stigma]|uniref:Uncharacterized protein n=1 Tax=Diatrype stigma TaxID=117547 RepID=A0AAN9UWQ4_9PEZI
MCFMVDKMIYCSDPRCTNVVSRRPRSMLCPEARASADKRLGACRAGINSYPSPPSRGTVPCTEHRQQKQQEQKQNETQQNPGGQQQQQ